MLYDPIKNSTSLVLDGQTLSNLEIFQNSHNGSTDGTVYKLLANSISPFGKRLFKQWLCHPLRRVEDINNRLDAVDDLIRLVDLHTPISEQMASLPDLERLISRIHSGRIHVKEFLGALRGFQTTCKIMSTMTANRSHYKSKLISQLIVKFPRIDQKLNDLMSSYVIADVDVDCRYPYLGHNIMYLNSLLDQKAETMVPVSGKNKEWDSINQKIDNLKDEFAKHLKLLQKKLG